VELKQRPAWPKRPTTKVRIPHYTPQQRDDLKARYEAGGRAFILLQVADEYLLIPMPQALLVGRATRAELYQLSAKRWVGKVNGRQLLKELSK